MKNLTGLKESTMKNIKGGPKNVTIGTGRGRRTTPVSEMAYTESGSAVTFLPNQSEITPA